MTYSSSPKFDLYLRALHFLGEVSQQLGLSEKSIARCRQLCEENWQEILRKDQIPRTILAYIYLVSHDNREVVSLRALEKILKSYNPKQNRKHIRQTVNDLNETLGLKIDFFQPIDYLPVVLEKINTSDLTATRFLKLKYFFDGYFPLLEQYSYQILDCLEKKDRVGRNPFTMAGAIIAGADIIVSRLFGRRRGVLNQHRIARIGEMNENTLRAYYIAIIKPIIEHMDLSI